MEDDEQKTFPVNCPLCSEEHRYPLKVSRSRSISYTTWDSLQNNKPRERLVRRYFICPTKNQKFALTLQLQEWSSEPINSVEIGEPIKE